MAEAKLPQNTPPETTKDSHGTVVSEEKAMKLVADMLTGNIVDIRPQLDFASPLGFFYPYVESALDVKAEEAISILESLASKEILNRNFFERLLRCPQCWSVNLRPSTHCPRCGSGNIGRGRVLDHFTCKNVGL